MRRFSQRVVRAVAALVAIALGVVPEAAYAKCGDPFCFPHNRNVQPGHGEAIPQNASGVELASDYGLTLEKSDGGAIYFQLRPGANGTQVLIPYEKIVGETYVAKSPYYSCPRGDAGVLVETFSFADPVPVPTELGTVTVDRPEDVLVDITGGAGGDGCLMDVPGKRVRFHITPSPSLTPWLPLTRWQVAVDGHFQPLLHTGGLLADGGLVPWVDPPFDDRTEPLALILLCGKTAQHLQVFADTVGIDTPLASDVFDMDIACPDQDAGNSGPYPLTGGVPPAKDPPSCGCSGITGGPFAVLIALVLRRRRHAR